MSETIENGMDFIARRRQAERDAQEKNWRRYIALAHKGATDRLTTKEDAELDALLPLVGRSIETLEADANVFRNVGALKNQCADTAKIQAEVAARDNAFAEAQKQFDAMYADGQKKLNALGGDCRAATAELEKRNRLAEELQEAERVHWRILGLENPVVAASKRHIVFAASQNNYGKPKHSMIVVENLMLSPSCAGDFDPKFYVRLDGQPDEEFQDLLARAEKIVRSGRQWRYLALAGDENPSTKSAATVQIFEGRFPGNFRIEDFLWMPMPGQTQEELDGLLKKLARKIEAQQRQTIAPY